MVRLTKTLVDGMEAAAKPYYVSDDDVRGFRVRIFPSGTKSFWACYRTGAGTPRRMSLGRYGAITCDEARRLAKVVLGNVAGGEDPVLERRTRRNSMRVSELCDLYLADMKKGLIQGKRGLPKQDSTIATDIGRVERHIKPLLGTRLLRDLTATDMRGFVRDISRGATAATQKTKPRGKSIVRGGAGAARRTFGLLSGILSFAVDRGHLDRNPALGVRRPADGQRTRRLNGEEYKKLGDAIRAADEIECWQVVVGIKLIALSGCRLGEIAKLRWSEVDHAQGCLRLQKTKEGQSLRPIGDAFMFALSEAPKSSSEFVLPGVGRDGYFRELGKGVKRLAQGAGFVDVTAHTLRHSYASVAGDQNFSISTIGAMLGHTSGGVTAKYVHHLDSLLRAAANQVANQILAQMQFRVCENEQAKAA
ncbi:MAG: DUF4102 domain-containing protein [Alphaproteobacteria bacterium]|nr:MAG: DUF4102 domain-containing protein [Alphaproteobacteria bacterium]